MEKELLLGKHTPLVEQYSPELLYPIPRDQGRDTLGLERLPSFSGVDVWHAYEMSWLDSDGRPVAAVGRFTIPAGSPNMIESKSFKLYLNSLNFERFADQTALIRCVTDDLSAIAEAPVTLELFSVDAPELAGQLLPGTCLDDLEYTISDSVEPAPELLQWEEGDTVEQQLYSHLLRSLCPVTGQPDWATVWLRYRGRPLLPESLLAYIVSFRQHREFHEQCVERIFSDLMTVCDPQLLQVQAFYTRRGGLDINPYRSSSPNLNPLPRLNRQ